MDNTKSEEARQLFQESSELIMDITSKMQTASDSITLDSLSQYLEKRLTDVNFSFPPETDYQLTEEENDSIFKLMRLMEKTYAERLEYLSLPADTLSN